VAAGCGGGGEPAPTAPRVEATPAPASDEFGVYPPNTSLDEEEVVEAYVRALEERDGETLCRVVASWISGRFDIAGTDPTEESISEPTRCPGFTALTDFPWENRERRFVGATVEEFGEVEGDETLTSVPVTIRVRFEELSSKVVGAEPLEEVVWLTREDGAWRIAKLGPVAAWASLAPGSEEEQRAAPDIEAERRKFTQEVAEARRIRREYEESYRVVAGSASCPEGKTYPDPAADVVDYRHPAPASPTPQLPAADIRALHVHSKDGVICALFELAGDVETGTTFDFAIDSPGSDWGRGFSQGFEVHLREDGRARTTSGLDDQRRPIAVPAALGREGNRFVLEVDAKSFANGRPFPGSVAPSRPLVRFNLRADVTFEQSEARLLHDDLDAPESTLRLPYP
jgi:hypothetical protein